MSAQGSDVTIETSLGTFTVELYWDHAPKVRERLQIYTATETTTDVQELCRVGEERLLQWCHLSSDHSSMSSVVFPWSPYSVIAGLYDPSTIPHLRSMLRIFTFYL